MFERFQFIFSTFLYSVGVVSVEALWAKRSKLLGTLPEKFPECLSVG